MNAPINAYTIAISAISITWAISSLVLYFQILKTPRNPQVLPAYFGLVTLLRVITPSTIGATLIYLVCTMLSAGYVIYEQRPSAKCSLLSLAKMWTDLIGKYWKYSIAFSICFGFFYYIMFAVAKITPQAMAYPTEIIANAISGLIVGHLIGSAVEYLQATAEKKDTN